MRLGIVATRIPCENNAIMMENEPVTAVAPQARRGGRILKIT